MTLTGAAVLLAAVVGADAALAPSSGAGRAARLVTATLSLVALVAATASLGVLVWRAAGTPDAGLTVATPVLPGPAWVAGAWLLPAFACTAVALALSTWITVRLAAGSVSVVWVGAVAFAAGPGLGQAVLVLSAPVLPFYLALSLVASAVFWLRSDQLSVLGRTS